MSNAGYGNHDAPPGEDAKRDPIRGGGGAGPGGKGPAPPVAGPHADPALMNPEATPGTGALPEVGGDDEVDSTSS